MLMGNTGESSIKALSRMLCPVMPVRQGQASMQAQTVIQVGSMAACEITATRKATLVRIVFTSNSSCVPCPPFD
jgi:hypothetical protein